MASKASSVAEVSDPALVIKETRIEVGGELLEDGSIFSRSDSVSMGDPLKYTAQGGLLTFRGGPLRQNAAYGTVDVSAQQLKVVRGIRTTVLDNEYTGFSFGSQPLIVKWYKNIREMMNIEEASRNTSAMKEVIYPSNDGRIYFLDLETQIYSREPIDVGFPMRTTASVNPYGYPLLYVGQSTDTVGGYKGVIGMRMYNLLNQKMIAFEPGMNPNAYTESGPVMSSALVETGSDTLIYGSSNGMLRTLSLNTQFNLETGDLTVDPQSASYMYKTNIRNAKQGIISGVAAYGDYVYFGDLAGSIQCVDMNTLQPVWVVNMDDSIVGSVALETGEDGEVYLYAGTAVNRREKSSPIRLVKINALTGEIIWECQNEIKCKYASKPIAKGIYPGAAASPLVGQGDINDLIIFNVNNVIDADKKAYAVVYALDKMTGEEVWSQPLDVASVSSPIAMYQPDGKSYIVLGDDNGTLRLMDGFTGSTISTVNLGTSIQSSPAAYGNTIVVGTTGGMLYFVNLE